MVQKTGFYPEDNHENSCHLWKHGQWKNHPLSKNNTKKYSFVSKTNKSFFGGQEWKFFSRAIFLIFQKPMEIAVVFQPS